MKIHYPSTKFLGKTSPVIYEYLLNGLQQFGSVVIDGSLTHECRNYVEPNNPNHLTVFYINDKRIIYDWSDFKDYKADAREPGDYYFKIHFTEEHKQYPRCYPIGQTVGSMDYINNLQKLRDAVSEKKYEHDVIAKYRTTNYDIRLKAVEILKNSDLKVKAGLKDFNPGVVRPYAPANHKLETLTPYIAHMNELTRSKYVLALPAVDNSRAWKHTEGLGLGLPLIALDLDSKMPGYYDDCYIKVKDDLSDLIEKIEYYNNNEEARLEIAKKGQEYFDKYLSPRAMAKNIIEKVNNDV